VFARRFRKSEPRRKNAVVFRIVARLRAEIPREYAGRRLPQLQARQFALSLSRLQIGFGGVLNVLAYVALRFADVPGKVLIILHDRPALVRRNVFDGEAVPEKIKRPGVRKLNGQRKLERWIEALSVKSSSCSNQRRRQFDYFKVRPDSLLRKW
jgi:hypothetical protein